MRFGAYKITLKLGRETKMRGDEQGLGKVRNGCTKTIGSHRASEFTQNV